MSFKKLALILSIVHLGTPNWALAQEDTDNSNGVQTTLGAIPDVNTCNAHHDSGHKDYNPPAGFQCCNAYVKENGRCVYIYGSMGGEQQQAQAMGGASLYAACEKQTEAAESSCDPKQNQAMTGVMQMASSMADQMAQNGLSSGIQANCEKMGNLSQSVTVATGAYKGYCSSAFFQCQSACNTDFASVKASQGALATAADLKAVKDLSARCAGLSKYITAAMQDIQKYTNTSQQMTKCMQATNPALAKAAADAALGITPGANGGLAISEKCLLNQFDPSCAGQLAASDCSNPANASSTVCFCSIAANQSSSRCGGSSTLSSFPTSGNSSGGVGGTVDPGAFTGSGGGFGDGLAPLAEGKSQDNSNPNSPGMAAGGGGGGKGLINGGGTGANKPVAGAAGSRYSANIIGGYGYGGASSGGMPGGFRPSAAGAPRLGAGKGGAGEGPEDKVDLKQFLPGGSMDPSRALAGISGPDGITGPNSDIWQKVRTRYFSVKASLLP